MIRTVSTFGTYKFPVSPYSVNIKRVRGAYSGSTSNLWLQLHKGVQNSPTDLDISPPANATVPLDAAIPVAATWGEGYDYATDPIRDALGPVIYVLSTTRGTLTAATTENLFDLSVDIEEFAPSDIPVGVNTSVNNNASLTNQIWAEASGPNDLFDLIAYQASGAVAYLKISPLDTIVDGATPWFTMTVANAVSNPFPRKSFGIGIPIGGTEPFSFDASGPGWPVVATPTTHFGCTIVLESAAGPFLAANRLTGWKYQIKWM